MTDPMQCYKRQAAELAVDEVHSGMIVGLGHGSTAIFALRQLAERLREGSLRDVLGVPCSLRVEADARELGIPLTTLEEHTQIDLTIDGADEVAPDCSVIKGGGGALLREKIVAQASKREIIVVDESKLADRLGMHARVPIEVVPFGWRTQWRYVHGLGAKVELRVDAQGQPWVTDQGNCILDADFGAIEQPGTLAACLQARAGIVEHGLFIGLVSEVIVAGAGGIRRLRP